MRAWRLLLALTTLLAAAPLAAAAAAEAATAAVAGQLDLTQWDPAQAGPHRLDGEWQFAPGQLLSEQSDAAAFHGEQTALPGAWGREVTPPGARDRHGFATYALEIALPPDAAPLALRLSTVGTAYRLYADGEWLAGAGRVGTSEHDSVPAYQPSSVTLPDQPDRRVRLLLQVSNFHYARGGAREPFWIGSPEQLRAQREGRVGLSMFLAGAFLLLGLYHLTLWASRRSDRSPLWFAILCLGMTARGLSVDDVYLVELLPGLSWAALVRVEYLSMLVSLSAVALFMGTLFPKEIRPGLIISFETCCALAMSATLLLPVDSFSRGLPAMQCLVLFAAVAGPSLTLLAWIHGREGAGFFLVGLLALAGAAVHDVLISNGAAVPSLDVFGGRVNLQPFGQVFFALCQSAMLAMRASHNVTALEVAASEARGSRDDLERRVAERTAELEAANFDLQRMVEDDGLTRLANRRHFDDRLAEAWRDHARRGAPLALVMADIDHFKPYNDRYGHPAGDAALRRVAQASAACARSPLDLVARYGGEELVTLLADTALEGAVPLAERQRQAVAALGIPHTDSEIGSVTLSLGVASCVPKKGTSPQSLVERADAALYEAKRLGRNQVVADEPEADGKLGLA